MRPKYLLLLGLVLLLWLLLVPGRALLLARVEAGFNPLGDSGPYQIPEHAQRVHQNSVVIDLHADSLLWGRDLLRRGDRGHVDLPRLLQGGVALQVFGAVTQSSENLNFESNSPDTDRITLLSVARLWPPRAWGSWMQRALQQARELDSYIRQSKGQLRWVRNRDELEDLLVRRQSGEATVGAFMGLEGAHALEGDLDNVQRLAAAGFRMLGLAHFIDNAVAGSAHGLEKGGLTALGREVVREAERLGMLIDLAHISPRAFDEVIAVARQPLVISHTGVDGTCEGSRNLSDEQLAQVAASGGVVGIGMFPGAVCGQDVEATVRAIRHAVSVVGVDHLALGSDFDGSVRVPVDASGLPLITAALLRHGLSEEDVGKILGGNVLRVLREVWPER